MIVPVAVVFVLFPAIALGAERGEPCTNQWGEKATCTNIYSCKAAMDAVAIANGSTLYAAGIVCGYDTEPLVCCRTPADFAESGNNVSSSDGGTQVDLTAVSNFTDIFLNTNSSIDSNIFTNMPALSESNTSQFSTNSESTTSGTTSSGEVVFTSPPRELTSDTSTITPLSSTTNTLFESNSINPEVPSQTTKVPDALPLQSNDTSAVPEFVSRFPDIFSSPIFPDSTPNIISETTQVFTSDRPATAPSISSFTEPPTEIDTTTAAHVHKVLPDRNVCGIQRKRDRLPNAPISSIDEFPWMALLRYQDAYGYDAGFRCTGTLINNRYILTSAHCVVADSEAFELKSVRLGEWSISYPTDCVFGDEGEECPDKVVDVGVEKKIPHPNYNSNPEKNVALVRMERNVAFTDFVRPICLPVEHLQPPREGTILTTSGWGATLSGWKMDVKSKIHLPVLAKSKCSNTVLWFLRVLEGQVCVDATSRSTACKTDSGGPLMVLDEEDKPQWYLEGVIPEGFHCDRRGSLGVYTRVNKYIPWIIFTIGLGGT